MTTKLDHDIEAAYRALKMLADAPIEGPLPYACFGIRQLRALGYRGNGKPGDEIDLDGWKIKIVDDRVPSA